MLLISTLISTIYHAALRTSGQLIETEKKISQNAQKELSNLIFENEELTAALYSEQAKSSDLEEQLLALTEKYTALEQEFYTQAALLDAHRLCDNGRYKESMQKLQEIVDKSLSESGVQLFNSIAKTLRKKGFRISLR